MARARENHTATLLSNGQVLVTGGFGLTGSLASAEEYNPVTGAWSTTRPLAVARRDHTATLLPNGQVLVTGGFGLDEELASAEVYDQETKGWSRTGPLAMAREYHTATLLPNGQVLVTGGFGWAGHLASAELYYDPIAPVAPVVTISGNGSMTNDNTPTFSGLAEAISTVTILVDDTPLGATKANMAGHWTFTPTVKLADGGHTVRARATDGGGNTSADSTTNTFTVDATPPPPPVIAKPANGARTNNNQLAYSGTTEADSTVTIIVDGIPVGTTTVDAAGNWSFTLSMPLADGPHTVMARAADALGNTSADSNTITLTVDTTPPLAPAVDTPVNGSQTNNNHMTYGGTAEAGISVTVIVDGIEVGATTTNAFGVWHVAPPATLAGGSHTVRARGTDGGGNTSADSNTNTFTVDVTPPPAPVVNTPANDVVSRYNIPTYSGTAEPGSTVTVSVDGTEVGTTTADTSERWGFTPEVPLPDGPHSVRTTATDAAGNTSLGSTTKVFTVDTTPPIAPEVNVPEFVYTQKPTISGNAEPGSTITVWLDGKVAGTTDTNPKGLWNFTPGKALPVGQHQVIAIATDVAGNAGSFFKAHSFTIIIRSHYGWSCTTAPSLSATWALLVLALYLGRSHRAR
nr:Ig-like domain-containing protein [Hyalangium minutum]